MVENSVLNQILDGLGYTSYTSSEIRLIGGYFGNVYEIDVEVPLVIKIFNRELDSEEDVLSEIEWTQFLSDHGLSVIEPILIKGFYINNLSEKMFFVAYKRARGKHIDINNKEVWNSKLFNLWGQGMGTMHSLSKVYEGKRPEWHKQEIYQANLKDLDFKINDQWDNYLAELKTMSTSKDIYGIIHGDLHQQNLLYDNGEVTFIDFGDSECGWFAYDIAISIYHASQAITETEERCKFATSFCQSFMDGYAKVNSTSEIIKKIDFFINFRHLYSYVYHNQYLDKTNINKKQLNYLDTMKKSLINQTSYFEKSLIS